MAEPVNFFKPTPYCDIYKKETEDNQKFNLKSELIDLTISLIATAGISALAAYLTSTPIGPFVGVSIALLAVERITEISTSHLAKEGYISPATQKLLISAAKIASLAAFIGFSIAVGLCSPTVGIITLVVVGVFGALEIGLGIHKYVKQQNYLAQEQGTDTLVESLKTA